MTTRERYRRATPMQLLWATASVALSGAVAALLHHELGLSNLALVFLVAILVIAARWGLFPSIYASVLSVLVYDFLFVRPHYSFVVSSPHDVLSLAVFLIVATLTSHMTGRIRDQAEAVRQREARTAALYDLSRIVVGELDTDAIADAVVCAVAAHLDAEVAIRFDEVAVPDAGDDDLVVVTPLTGATGPVGSLVVRWPGPAPIAVGDERRQIEAFADLAAIAIERARLAGAIADARLRDERDRLQTLLLSSVSHDLRTPLSSIIGAATSLLDGGERYPREVRDDLALTIREEGERLDRFVGNLLEMSRLESGAVRLRRDWIEVGDIVGAALRASASRLSEHCVVSRPAPGLPMIDVDFVLLEQVLVNLLENAARYSPRGSTITITAAHAADVLTIVVEDDGVGIPPDELELVFDKFYRVHRGDRGAAGTGLGLSICRGILLEHGGTIRAESPIANGRGTRMTIELGGDAIVPFSSTMEAHDG